MLNVALIIIFASAPAAVFMFVKQAGDFHACMLAGALCGCIAACAVLVSSGIAAGGLKIRFNLPCAFVAMFVATAFISAVCSEHSEAAVRAACIVLIAAFTFYLLFLNAASGKAARLLWPAPVFSALFCGIAVAQYFGFDPIPEKSRYAYDLARGFRSYSFFGNPNLFADYIAISLPVCVGAAAFSRSRALRVSGAVSSLLIVTCLYIAGSRGAIAGAVAGAFVLVIMLFVSRKGRIFAPVAALAALLVCAGIVASYSSQNPAKRGSVGQRIMTWNIASSMLARHPLTGVGVDNFGREYLRYQAEYFKRGGGDDELAISSIEKQRHAHNDFLQSAAEMGIPGAVALIGLIITLAIGLTRNVISKGIGASASASLLGSLAAFCVAGSFSFPMRVPPTSTLLILLSACAAALCYKNENTGKVLEFPSPRFLSSRRIKFEAISLVALFSFYAALSISVEPLASGILSKQGQREMAKGLVHYSMTLCSKALIADRLNGDAAYCMGAADIQAGEFTEAQYFLEMALKTIDDPLIHYHLGVAFIKMKKYDEAEKEFKTIREMSPAYTGRLLDIAGLYMNEKMIDDGKRYYRIAIPLFKRQLNASPGDADIHLRLAECYLGLDDTAMYEKHLIEAMRLRPEDIRIKSAIDALHKSRGAGK